MATSASVPGPVAVFALVALAASSTGCVDIVATGGAGAVEREERRFPVQGRPGLIASTFDGSIEVRTWDRAEVLVEIEKHARDAGALAEIEVRAEQHGNQIAVEVRRAKESWRGWRPGRGARLIVSVPASADVAATTGDGSIDVERVSGRLELRTGDGAIHGVELSGDVRARTGDGAIRLERLDGRVQLGTGDGDVVVSGRMTALRARSGDGSITIRVEPGSVASEDWDVTTGDGSIAIDLPDPFDADIDAHTGDGRVSFDGRGFAETAEQTRRSLRARLGAGGHWFRVRSGDGSIRFGRE